jgi:hypothetical protein
MLILLLSTILKMSEKETPRNAILLEPLYQTLVFQSWHAHIHLTIRSPQSHIAPPHKLNLCPQVLTMSMI